MDSLRIGSIHAVDLSRMTHLSIPSLASMLVFLGINAALICLPLDAIAAQPITSNQVSTPPNTAPRVILNNDIVPTISEQFLREVFSGKVRHWPDGQPITVVVFAPEMNIHDAFIQQRLRMFPYQIQRLWNKRIYSGRAEPPLVVNDINTMRATVINTPGAIGYLPMQDIEPDESLRLYALRIMHNEGVL